MKAVRYFKEILLILLIVLSFSNISIGSSGFEYINTKNTVTNDQGHEKKYSLSAGAAKGCITPPISILPISYPSLSMSFDRIDDDIFVRVLSLYDGEEESLFITFDMCGVPYPKETMEYIKDVAGIKEQYIFMSATHTHEAPFMGLSGVPSNSKTEDQMKEWYTQILDVLKHTIVQARDERKPARIGYRTGKSYVNINRDEIIEGKGTIGNNFERPSDKTLALVRLEDYNGTPIAFIVNYAVHAVVLNGNSLKIGVSGDLPGRTSAALEEKFEGAVALWTSGAAGDQNPRIMSMYGVEMVDGQLKVNSLGESAYLILDFLTKEHVRDILKVNDSLNCDDECARILASECIAVCPGQVTNRETGNLSAPHSADEKAPDAEFILRLLTIGDIAFEGISAEVVTTIGTALKEASPYRKTMVVTHVTHLGCYVTDDWGYENETFEAEGTLVQRGYAQPAFLKGFEEMFREMLNQ